MAVADLDYGCGRKEYVGAGLERRESENVLERGSNQH